MRKSLYTAGVILAVLFCLTTSVFAEGTLDTISKRGEFIVGVRDGAIPFGFFNEKNEQVGFSIDMANEFKLALEKKFAKPLKIELKTVNPKTRIPLVANGTIDMECGSTTHTIGREETVDFSITVFLTGSQLLVKKNSKVKSAKDLAGKKVGLYWNGKPGVDNFYTAFEELLKKKFPTATTTLLRGESSQE